MATSNHHSNSAFQVALQQYVLKEIQKEYGVCFGGSERQGYRGANMVFDGYAEKGDEIWLFEVYSRFGKPKSAQAHKVMTDAFKMHAWALANPDKHVRCHLIFVGTSEFKPMEDYFRGNRWQAKVLEFLAVEICTVNLPSELKNQLLNTQLRQLEGMK